MSGLESAVARIHAIERMVAGARSTAIAAHPKGADSFAAVLDRATVMDASGPSTAVIPAAAAPGALPTGTTVTPATVTPAAASPAAAPPASVSRPEARATTASDGAAARAAAGGSYRPAHVTETDERVWNDCTWASAAMWIDKLTGGAVKVDREALRAASGDTTGGSSLDDVVRGARKLLGLDLHAARAERLTVDGLLDRLASGGGALVQGSYASLPPNLTRHDRAFAARGVAASGHAVYVGPLDRATGKVWWDDPLAPAGGSGQWIDVKDLRKFLWTDGHGRVSALATPDRPGATSATRAGAGASAGVMPASADAASISAAARSAGVDRVLLSAYVDVARTPSDAVAIDSGARDLAAALTRYGRADLALESLGAARAGAAGPAGGEEFAAAVVRRWAALLGRSAGG